MSVANATSSVDGMSTQPSVSPSADLELNKRNLDEFGYAVHENFLSAAEVTALRLRLEEQAVLEREAGVATLGDRGHASGVDYRTAPEDCLPPLQQIDFLPNKGRVFIDLCIHPVSQLYLRHVFNGIPYNLVSQAGSILRKGATQMVIHADQQALPFLTPVPVMLNIFVVLSDFDADMGATRLVPGSHRMAPPKIAPHPQTGGAYNPEPIETVAVTAQAGAALIWESRTWHCSGASTSDKTRYAISNVYALHFMKPQDIYPAVLHDDVCNSLTAEEKRMLGFEVAFEYAGRIAPRNPTDTRSNTNCRFPYVPELRRGSPRRAVAALGMGNPRTAEQARVIT
jgi:ectoine hydroxylase-related dioxygenase (phytanoyl-CoA dioxygenase family)